MARRKAGRTGVFVFGVATAVAMVTAVGGAVNAQATYETEPREPEYIYDRTCGYCHGHNVGPIILGRGLSPQVVSYFVRNGNGAMPAFRPTEITNAELEALAEWVASSEADETEHGQ